ncbi:MAG TPA: response regulator transcription factor [Armatimonadota bacterium]|nr:response regulator transcription factor [Armatimonadota bacterium]
MSAQRMLVIEDDPDTQQMLTMILRSEGYDVLTAGNGPLGLELLRKMGPDLVVLDWMLPGMDGLEVCRRAREISGVPIIMLTAKSATEDRIAGLDVGADDYLAKPFEPEELLARIRAQLRRATMAGDGLQRDKPIQVGDLRLEPASHEVWLRGQQVGLTRLEFNLLYCMAQRAGKVLTREDILRLVWGENEAIDLRGIDAHIRRLRAKVEDDPDQPRRIQTVHGVGYKMATA